MIKQVKVICKKCGKEEERKGATRKVGTCINCRMEGMRLYLKLNPKQ